MHASDITKEYLSSKSIPNSCQTETVYRYHVDLDSNSRLSGCEMVIRTEGQTVVISAVLPIVIRRKEYRGVARALANYNHERVQKDQCGVFELNYVTSRIQFTVAMRELKGTEKLAAEVDYCLGEIQAYSEAMMHLVCEESDAVYEEEQEKLESERKAAERAERTRQYKNTPVMGKLMSFLGIIDEEVEDDTFCLAAPAEPVQPGKTEEKAEAVTEEKAKEKIEEKTQESAEA